MHKDARSRRVANWKQAAGFALWQAGIIFGNTNPPISFRKTPKTTTYSAYDALGRVLTSNQSTAGTTYNFSYSYNLTDALISETYPSGRIVNICYDGANRESQVGGNCAAPGLPPYMTGGQYAAHGEFAQYQYGNGVQRNVGFNSRLQPLTLTDQLNTQTLFNLSLNWGATKNNGNLQSATYANGGLTFTDNFSYDGVNRLLTANDSGGWSRTFTYDAFGNMTAAGNPGVTSLPFNGNNQIVGAPYDQAGNQLKVNGNSVAYDFENHIVDETDGVSQAIETYVYDGDGRRVEKYGPGGTPRTVFVYDALGRLAAEYHSTATVPSCITCYLSDDHLGTPRLITDSNGLVAERHDYLPFGEEVAAGTFGRNQTYGSTAGVISQKFTGKERDSESGLDYFGARYYGSAFGRFTSPDEPLVDQEPRDPQSWNLYTYVRNSPLRNVDSDGRTCSHAKGPNGEDIVTNLDGKGCAELYDNTVHAYDPGIAMLAGIGETLTNPHNVAQFVSDAARATASVIAPQPSAIAECITPGGNCDSTNLGLAMLPFGLSKLPKWAETAGGFINYLKSFEGKIALTAEEADAVIAKAKEIGVDVRLDPPHPGTNWDKPHLNIGRNGQLHLEVPAGYDHPGVPKGSATKPRP